MNRTRWLIGAALIAASAGAMAEESMGSYMTFIRSASDARLPDGNIARLVHYYHAGTSDKASSPFADKTSECLGRMIYTAAGKFVSGHGHCFAQDASGNGGSWTWKATESGTERCPTVCGTFQWAEGYGSARNVAARGTWTQTYGGKDGGAGTYTLSFTP